MISMLIPPSCTSCPPCGSEFLLRGGDKSQSKRLPQGGQEVQEGKLRSDGSNPQVRHIWLLAAWTSETQGVGSPKTC